MIYITKINDMIIRNIALNVGSQEELAQRSDAIKFPCTFQSELNSQYNLTHKTFFH